MVARSRFPFLDFDSLQGWTTGSFSIRNFYLRDSNLGVLKYVRRFDLLVPDFKRLDFAGFNIRGS